MSTHETKKLISKETPLKLSANAKPFQFNSSSPSFTPNQQPKPASKTNAFDPSNLPTSPPSSTDKNATYYSPSQFYQMPPYFYGGVGYGMDASYYGYGNSPQTNVSSPDSAEPAIIPDTIVFKNLSFAMTDDELFAETVAAVGECVASVTRVTDKKGRFKGTAFVKFVSAKDAEMTKNKMQGMEIMGRPVKLEYMRAKTGKVTKKKKKKAKAKANKKKEPSPVVSGGLPPSGKSSDDGSKSSTTATLIPLEGFDTNINGSNGSRRIRTKSRGNSDLDLNWRAKKSIDSISLPEDAICRAACMKLLEFKKSKNSKPILVTVSSVQDLKELIRISKAINLNHQIEEVTGDQWKVKFTRVSFFENLRGAKNERRFRSWSSENNQSRSARGMKKESEEKPERVFMTRRRTRTFSREIHGKDAGARRDRSESLSMYARGPDGTCGFRPAGRGYRMHP